MSILSNSASAEAIEIRLLKLSYFTALTMNLRAHSLNLAPDIIKLHDVLAQPKPSKLPENSPYGATFPFEKPQQVPKPDDFALSCGVHIRFTEY